MGDTYFLLKSFPYFLNFQQRKYITYIFRKKKKNKEQHREHPGRRIKTKNERMNYEETKTRVKPSTVSVQVGGTAVPKHGGSSLILGAVGEAVFGGQARSASDGVLTQFFNPL